MTRHLRSLVGCALLIGLTATLQGATDLAVAVALFDAEGNLLGATEASHTGVLDPDEAAEMKLTFREVKRKLFEAKTAQFALETWK